MTEYFSKKNYEIQVSIAILIFILEYKTKQNKTKQKQKQTKKNQMSTNKLGIDPVVLEKSKWFWENVVKFQFV